MRDRIELATEEEVKSAMDGAIAIIVVTDDSVLFDVRCVSLADFPSIYFGIACTFIDSYNEFVKESEK